MELDVKQYLHYYIGQPVRYRYIDWEKDSWTPWCAMSIRDLEKIIDDMSLSMFEIQFRKLSSMTEEEMKELYFFVFKKHFVGDNITHRDIDKKDERWVLWSGVERLFIYKDGDVGADSDLHHYRVNPPKVMDWQIKKGFWLFGDEYFEQGLIIEKK